MPSKADKNANKPSNPSRRRFVNSVGTLGAVGLSSFLLPKFAQAQKKHTLRILQWNHFVPEFDHWFDKLTQEW